MEVLRNGKFTITLGSRDLARGLRKKSKNPRDVHAMTTLTGLVSKDGVLTAMNTPTRIDTSVITDTFPYPQIFVLSNYILICDSTKIYTYNGSSMTLVYTASQAGSTWKCIDFIEFLLMTNNDIVVQRSASSGTFTEVTDIPEASALCNYNGQVLLGGPKD